MIPLDSKFKPNRLEALDVFQENVILILHMCVCLCLNGCNIY